MAIPVALAISASNVCPCCFRYAKTLGVCTKRGIPNPFEAVVALLASATGAVGVDPPRCLRKSGFAVVESAWFASPSRQGSMRDCDQLDCYF